MQREPAGLLPVQPSTGRFQPVPGDAYHLAPDGFWGRRQSFNADRFLKHCDEWITRMGWVECFAIASNGTPALDRQGKHFTDSDVYKHAEALSWEAGRSPGGWHDQRVQELGELIHAAQEPDGYLNTYWGHRGKETRYTNLSHGHELYCAGHLLQAAVARLRTHDDDSLTRAARRLADRICQDFGPDGRDEIDGHPEIELGLVELYRATGADRYLEQAQLFVERHGRRSLEQHAIGWEYYQDDVPIRDAEVFRGHVVRALYLAAAAVDVAVETGDAELLSAVAGQWDATVERRTYVTGGMGSRHLGESFGNDFELPPDRAYTETCGAVGSIMLAYRLLLATGEVRFADHIERTLYNMVATALEADGCRFFYVNPLHQRVPGIPVADDEAPFRKDTLRAPWFWVSCCPTNVARLLATLAAYFVTVDQDGLQIHQYASGSLTTEMAGGSVQLAIATDYPWRGRVHITVERTPSVAWQLNLRVPAWAEEGASLTVNNRSTNIGPGYASERRQWHAGDEVILDLPVVSRMTWPDPRIDALRGTVAIERGPLVYAVESPDLTVGLDAFEIDTDASMDDCPSPAEFDSEVVSVRVTGRSVDRPSSNSWPYYSSETRAPSGPLEATLIPYHLWANRGVSTMRIWIPSINRRRAMERT